MGPPGVGPAPRRRGGGRGKRAKRVGCSRLYIPGRSHSARLRFATSPARTEARQLARDGLADVAKGGDPAEQRAADRDAMTVAELCREYLDRAERGLIITRRRKPKKESTLYTDRGRVDRHIVPLLGHRTVKDITPADVRAFIRD